MYYTKLRTGFRYRPISDVIPYAGKTELVKTSVSV